MDLHLLHLIVVYLAMQMVSRKFSLTWISFLVRSWKLCHIIIIFKTAWLFFNKNHDFMFQSISTLMTGLFVCAKIHKTLILTFTTTKSTFRRMTAKVSNCNFIWLIARKMFYFVVCSLTPMRCNFNICKTSQKALQMEPQISTNKFCFFILLW